jgi:hypothetical protein
MIWQHSVTLNNGAEYKTQRLYVDYTTAWHGVHIGRLFKGDPHSVHSCQMQHSHNAMSSIETRNSKKARNSKTLSTA